MREKRGLLIVILGPTASGKTTIALQLAQFYKSILISADSRQFYKEMTIGTCRTKETETLGVPVYFSGQLSIKDYYSAGRFEADVLNFLNEMFPRYPVIFLAGGTGLYIDAVCSGIGDTPAIDMDIRKKILEWLELKGEEELLRQLKIKDPEYYEKVDKHNTMRVIRALEVIEQTGMRYSGLRKDMIKPRSFDILKIGLEVKRPVLYDRIDQRVDRMMEEGLLEEVIKLKSFQGHVALQTVGYSELLDYLEGNTNLETAVRLIKRNTRHYAKRQLTWFKRDSMIHWVSPDDVPVMKNLINAMTGNPYPGRPH